MRRSISRREFLQVSAGAGAAAVLTSTVGCVRPAAAAPVPIGVQLYCFRHQMAEDVPGTIARVAGLGFEAVEFAGYFGHTAEELRRILDDNGLRCCGTHIGLPALQGDELQRTVEFNQTLGNPYLIVASLPSEAAESKENLIAAAETFNAIAAELEPHGMRTGYHAHAYSFETEFDGMTLWDIFAENTVDEVILQMDTGNGSAGGGNIPEAIRRYPGRTVTMHVKPHAPSAEDPFAPYIGDDELNWPLIFELSESVGGIEYYIVEYEEDEQNPFEPLRANLERVRALTS